MKLANLKKSTYVSLVFFVIISIFSWNILAQKLSPATSSKNQGGSAKELSIADNPKLSLLVGNTLKVFLEHHHYKKIKIDDKLSQNAFKKYLEQIDFGKQFLIQEDVKFLKSFELKFDDMMEGSVLSLLDQTMIIKQKRIAFVQSVVDKFFKAPMNWGLKEKFETDQEKRVFLSSLSDLEKHWGQSLVYSVVVEYLTQKEDQIQKEKKIKEGRPEKDLKKTKPEVFKALTDDELKKKSLETVQKRYTKLFKRLQKETHDDYLELFYNAVTSAFDPHTNYMPPKRKKDFDIDISGSLEGIGAVLQEDDSYIKVVQIVPGGAAWRQKELEVDDLLLAVAQGSGEPLDLVDMRVDEAVQYIRGKKGTEVRLTVKKSTGEQKIISIIREVVEIGESYAKSSVIQLANQKNKIGYISLPKFYRDFDGSRNCTDDVRREIERLKVLGIKGIILDLRDNGGGALEDARQISGLFVKEGPVVQVKDSAGEVEVLTDNDKSIAFDGKLIILVNSISASASEILAAAMQDYKRAVIIGGDMTYGKGTVQTVVELNKNQLLGMLLPDIGALKFTIQKFYRINGGSTQEKGVIPDLMLPDSFGHIEQREKDMPFVLNWDEIKAQPYNVWGEDLKISHLKAQSKKRVATNPRLKIIQESVDFLVARRKQSLVSLDLESIAKEDKKNRDIVEKLKMEGKEQKNANVIVSDFEQSLKDAIHLKNEDEAHWKEDFEKRKTEWIEKLQKDAVLEESLNVMYDMI